MRNLLPFSSMVSSRHQPEPSMTTSVRLHRHTCGFERQDVGIYDTYLDADACSWPPVRAPADAPCVGEWSPGPRDAGNSIEERVGLPGYWVIRFARAMVDQPAGCDLDSPFIVEVARAFTENSRLGTRNVQDFVAAVPRPTRSRTYASPAASPRPSQGSLPARAAHPLAGRDSHPLDDVPNFTKLSHPRSFRTSLAWSQLFSLARLSDACTSGFDAIGSLRKSVGLGVRWQSPIGPLRFEWGLPLDLKPGEKADGLLFSIGGSF